MERHNFGFEHGELRCLSDIPVVLLSRQLDIQVQDRGEIWPGDTNVGVLGLPSSTELG